MSEAAASQQPGRPAVTQERATIRINDIPTELLERLLGKYVQQVNENYKKKQGELKIQDFDETKDIEQPIIPKKRVLAEASETIDGAQELSDRMVHLNKTLPLYGYFPDGNGMIEVSTRTDEPMADVLQVAVDQIMTASIRYKHGYSDINIKKSTLSQMTQWTALFFHLLTTRLQRLMEIQRRRLPNSDDLLLLLKEGYFDRKGIDEMHTLCERYYSQNSHRNKELHSIAKHASTAYTGQDYGDFNSANDSVVMEEPWWIDQVIHRKKRKAYIPEWMPPLPPEHTFKSTPKYSQRVTNPVMLREKLVLEGRYGEKALDHIIVKEESTLCSPLSQESISSSDDEEEEEQEQIKGGENNISTGREIEVVQKSTQNEKSDINNDNTELEAPTVVGLDVKSDHERINDSEGSNEKEKTEESTLESATPSDKKVDLVELANKRMAVLENKRKEEEQRYLSRIESDESRFGRNFGFYSNVKKLPDGINVELQEYRNKKLREVVHNLRKQEKKNSKWVIEQEELRRRLDEEKSKYAEANQIQLGSGQDAADENIFYADMDEEVDFDVEFSDMEEVEDGENLPKPPETKTESIEPAVMDNDSNDEERVLSVRFQDELETSALLNSTGDGEERDREGEGEGDIEREDPEAKYRSDMQEEDHDDCDRVVMDKDEEDESVAEE
ncbi:hypothetical protein PICMEDRAFT_14570 [Pichia membranifaciens NRRL Y-2026]|uniref:Transcription initiation factor TFIID subunit 8 n=1 Tax=Pichia membranifaciens NRRL Y-2026 TaxID=763406 RepID=A0A1E3NSV5_9ASCO|nr:hypothetical protein PICMEDRAFT_14570 [Pichia membranifaciens NRRL Y-2026]ODQ49086.1 hypothetical protein PICMEDRAFT_14570 [Pichia membranifaciens NRRL Y-2026]